ncbi:hypothetical protein J3A83DRAFT_4191288 [Scleroderma citrinum]
MLNTDSPYRWNQIKANSGLVGTVQDRVVVFGPENFYFQVVGNDTYELFSDSQPGSVQASLDNRIIVEDVITPQVWVITPYEGGAYYTIRNQDNGLAWTDGGGSPGPNHQLYLNAFDPNNIPPAQRFTFNRVGVMGGNIQRR